MQAVGALLVVVAATVPLGTALTSSRPRGAAPKPSAVEPQWSSLGRYDREWQVKNENTKRFAVFTTSTSDQYLNNVATGFQLMMDVNAVNSEEIDYFVAGKFDSKHKMLLMQNAKGDPFSGIHPLNLDVQDFAVHCSKKMEKLLKGKGKEGKNCLPAEAHWWSVIPEMLANEGYEMSMYIDAADVVALKPLNLSAIRNKFLETKATIAVSPVGSKSSPNSPRGEFVGDKINTGIIMFNNTAATATGFASQYAQFYENYKDQDKIKVQNGAKVEKVPIESFGQRSGSQYLELWQRSADQKPIGIKFTKLEPQYQMMCGSDLSLIEYFDKHPPMFVHLRDECHLYIYPESTQRGIPRDAKATWNRKSVELFGEKSPVKLSSGSWMR